MKRTLERQHLLRKRSPWKRYQIERPFPSEGPRSSRNYSIRQTYGRLLDLLEKAFERKSPLFTLPIYYPLAYYKGDDKSIDPFEENRRLRRAGRPTGAISLNRQPDFQKYNFKAN